MASELSPRVTFFGEISFTARADAGTGTPPATGFNTEVERMILRFDQSDQLKVSFGRYHTPINYWNTAFHHGQWLQTTIARPEMIQFGGRFLPVHFVGALVEGVAAGRRLEPELQGRARQRPRRRSSAAAATPATSTAIARGSLNAFSKPDSSFGLEFGGSFYGDRVTLASGGEFDEQIVVAATRCGRRKIRRSSRSSPACGTEARRAALGDLEPRVLRPGGLPAAAVRTGCGSRTSASSTSASTPDDVVFATVPNLDGSTRRRALRRVAVRGDQGRVPDLDARRGHACATTAGSFRCVSRSDGARPLDRHAVPRAARCGSLVCAASLVCRPAAGRRRPAGRRTSRWSCIPTVAGRQSVAGRAAPHPARRPRVLVGRRARHAAHPRARSRASATSPSQTSAR